MLQGVDRAAETMRRLRNLGLSRAIDDFGTGHYYVASMLA